MVDALTDAGFDTPRASKNYITAKDPDTGERWCLKGEIFHEDWLADPAEREAKRGAGYDQAGSRRLDGIPTGELQQNCDKCAEYHRDRYLLLSGRQQERIAEAEQDNPALADDLSLGNRRADHVLDRVDDAPSWL